MTLEHHAILDKYSEVLWGERKSSSIHPRSPCTAPPDDDNVLLSSRMTSVMLYSAAITGIVLDVLQLSGGIRAAGQLSEQQGAPGVDTQTETSRQQASDISTVRQEPRYGYRDSGLP